MADRLRIETCTAAALAEWVVLRQALWPEVPLAEQAAEAAALLGRTDAVAFLARTAAGEAIGFAEATLRQDPAEPIGAAPVAFLEGVLVRRGWRRRGAARLLCEAVEAWAIAQGCGEIASDAELGNLASRRLHAALRFEERQRIVCFRKRLKGPGA
jgi:aminoglycoside 6'-N-acetyltransferase I